MRFGDQRKVSDEIPTASMADITFLLIIYFMVTTTFSSTRGLDFAPPKEDDTPLVVEKEDSVLIEIRSDGSLLLDQRPIELADLIAALVPKLAANPAKPVIIHPDPTTTYGLMVDVMDELRQGREKGLQEDVRISLPTQREIEAFWY